MTKEQFAAMLNGREYGSEISREESALAKKSGLVVVFGYSDDNMEFRGALDDEIGCYGGETFHFDRHGYVNRYREGLKSIEAIWDADGYSWTYKTDIPHATFDIMEDGETFCRGIVFDVKELG